VVTVALRVSGTVAPVVPKPTHVEVNAVRVLVVAENVTERLRAVTALKLHAEAEVTEAAVGEEGRQLLLEDQSAFDVIVVDGDLQPRGGYAILYDLRQQAKLHGTASIPAVVLLGREQDRWLATWCGANAALLKPIDPFELARVVRDLQGATIPSHGGAAGTAQQERAVLEGRGVMSMEDHHSQ